MINPIIPKPQAAPTAPDQEAERRRILREAQELQVRAYALAGFGKESIVTPCAGAADLLAAIDLYEQAALTWEQLGNRAYEAKCARHMGNACRTMVEKAEKVA